MSVVDNHRPRLIAVSTVGPDGSTTPVPKDAITRSAGVITVALGDRQVSQVRIGVGRITAGSVILGDVWVYPP
jgi:hypothetical protein